MADTFGRVGTSLGTFAPPGWQEAIDNVMAHGREEDLDQGTTIGFKTVTGDPDGVHHKSTMNIWGECIGEGKFRIDSVALDDQDWKLGSDGKLHVDEWIHTLPRDAGSWMPLHYFQIVDHGNVENSGSLPQSAGDPRKNLASLIGNWAKYQAPPPGPGIKPPCVTGVRLR